MKDNKGVVIYVGKAKNLKNRVSSYFNLKHTGKTEILVNNINDFEYIITNSDLEALLLEINLIKKYDPKYNILLKDDKSYPYIEITNEKYPRLLIVRPKSKNKNSRLYGPYPNVYAARKTIEILNRLYPLRKCTKLNKKACLYYHINECLGYCINTIDAYVIENMTNEIIKFLKGNHNIVTDKLKLEMDDASSKMNYEKALEMKDALDYIKITLRGQLIDFNNNEDIDVFGYYIDRGYICIQVLFLRGGKLTERDSSIYPIISDEIEDLTYFISNFYEKYNIKPTSIFIPKVVDINIIKDVLNINVYAPIKGNKKKLLDMACNNAKNSLKEKFDVISKNEDKNYKVLDELKSLLNINSVDRIEAIDNSHLFGTYSVSGVVVFTLGKPDKKLYRKYKINDLKNDDYNIMKEVVYRRYYRALMENTELPNLIIVDGGKIQINAVLEVINSLNLNINVVGLVKDDKHKTRGLIFNDNIIDIDHSSNLFHFLETIQDEVHNFVIRYHKDIRSKGALESFLDNIPGIGKSRRELLLKTYSNSNDIKSSSIEELSKLLPISVAKNLYDYFKNN